MTRRNSSETPGLNFDTGSGFSFMMEYIIAASCSPLNGIRPVSISKRRTP